MVSQRPGPKPSGGPRVSGKANQGTSRGRVSRACDRCRIKKAKCDGAQACKTCRASDSQCVYSARRREARNYYCQMLEVTDKALQRLYWACQRRSGFPGKIPNEAAESVTTVDILKGLGLIGPDFDEFGLPKELDSNTQVPHSINQARPPLHTLKPRDHEDFVEDESIASSISVFNSPQVCNDQAPTAETQVSTLAPTTPINEFDMKQQFVACPPSSRKPVLHGGRRRHSQEHEQRRDFFHQSEDVAEVQHVDINAFVDLSFCTAPHADLQSPSYDHPLTQHEAPPMTTPQLSRVQRQQSPLNPMYDSYLSLWPGSLAAAYPSVAT